MKVLTVVVAAALSCTALAECGSSPCSESACGERGRHGGLSCGEGMMDPMVWMVSNPMVVEKLGLSAEQVEKAKAIAKGLREKNRETEKALREAMEREVALLKAETTDEAAVMKSLDEIFELRKAMAKVQTKGIIEIKALLTAEQLQKAVAEMDAFHKKMKFWAHPHDKKPKGCKDKAEKPVKS